MPPNKKTSINETKPTDIMARKTVRASITDSMPRPGTGSESRPDAAVKRAGTSQTEALGIGMSIPHIAATASALQDARVYDQESETTDHSAGQKHSDDFFEIHRTPALRPVAGIEPSKITRTLLRRAYNWHVRAL
jgi:hypothetical protein